MSAAPRWQPESPAERTDPLLPVISDEMPPPRDLSGLASLDDRRLAGLLAELDAEDLFPTDDPADPDAVVPDPVDPGSAGLDSLDPDPAAAGSAVSGRPELLPAVVPAQVRSRPVGANGRVADGPVVDGRVADGRVVDGRVVDGHVLHVRAEQARGRYVRREYVPPPVSADTVGLTGLTRRVSGRCASMLFTGFFLAIFLLILIEVVVSLIRASS